MESHPKTGLLIHGRHLKALRWEQMMWGDVDSNRLGTLPTAVLAMLNEGAENVAVITIGTGASQNASGTREAQVIKDLFVSRLEKLEHFSSIKDHPRWLSNKELIGDLARTAIVDVHSQNTADEIRNAAALFTQNNVSKVIEVTGASHAPRCQLLQGVARAKGFIPDSQQWHLVADDVPYANTEVGDTIVFEEPHRGDDPNLHIPKEIRPATLFGQFFTIPKERQEPFLEEVASLFEKYRPGH